MVHKTYFPWKMSAVAENFQIFTLWSSFISSYVRTPLGKLALFFSEIRSGRQRRWWIAGKTKNKRGHRFDGRCSHYRTDGGHHTYRFAATRLWGIVSQILTFPWNIEYLVSNYLSISGYFPYWANTIWNRFCLWLRGTQLMDWPIYMVLESSLGCQIHFVLPWAFEYRR